jgi:hypothetical protein
MLLLTSSSEYIVAIQHQDSRSGAFLSCAPNSPSFNFDEDDDEKYERVFPLGGNCNDDDMPAPDMFLASEYYTYILEVASGEKARQTHEMPRLPGAAAASSEMKNNLGDRRGRRGISCVRMVFFYPKAICL